jgi:hypothetical protein
MRTAELSGAALTYAVTMLEMPHLVWGKTIGIHHASDQIVVPELPEPKCYSPFYNWTMFGPIIEREHICLGEDNEGKYASVAGLVDYAKCKQISRSARCWGRTFLVAAMRCYVSSRLGDDVDIPEVLQ